MKCIYISGPISSEIQSPRQGFISAGEKLARFDRAEKYLTGQYPGVRIINPLKVKPCEDLMCDPGQLADQPPYEHTWGCWMKHDIRALMEADTIALLPGWSESNGAVIEYFLADSLKYETLYLNENGEIEHA